MHFGKPKKTDLITYAYVFWQTKENKSGYIPLCILANKNTKLIVFWQTKGYTSDYIPFEFWQTKGTNLITFPDAVGQAKGTKLFAISYAFWQA